MRFYCTANAIPLIKLTYSPRFYENISGIGTPIFGKLPVTREKVLRLFEESEELVLCRTLDEAKALRRSRITVGNTNVTPEFFKGAIAQGYPLADFAIYEIEIADDVAIAFTALSTLPAERLEQLLSFKYYSMDRDAIPGIDLSIVRKMDLNPRLVDCHYYSLTDDHDEVVAAAGRSCVVM